VIRHDALDPLPVRGALPALNDSLEAHGAAVLVAPPGTGKTTLVPLALAGLLDEGPPRRVVVAEPRRIAARAAARRMAWLLGEKVGDSVGFTVRGERVVVHACAWRSSRPVCCCNASSGTRSWRASTCRARRVP